MKHRRGWDALTVAYSEVEPVRGRDGTGNRQVFHRNAQPNLCPIPDFLKQVLFTISS
ncbi:MAG: hypothetical protein ICV78_14975, partial [Tolypothrix sp. Co-bin9]|nr:hypothetical protein [Tolypothrix sp. Co-bin9]